MGRCQDIDSRAYLLSFFIFALIETFLCSGITYGWASIVVVFKMEHFYLDLCKDYYEEKNLTMPDLSRDLHDVEEDKLPGCPKQEAMFNLILTVSLFLLCSIKFPAGIFVDKCGPRIARAVGGVVYLTACMGLAFVTVGYEWLLFVVFAGICQGGSLLVIAVFQMSNIIYRENSSRILCVLHGAFDSSSVVLLVFKLIYEQDIELRVILSFYSAICLVLIVVGTCILSPPMKLLFEWVEDDIVEKVEAEDKPELGLLKNNEPSSEVAITPRENPLPEDNHCVNEGSVFASIFSKLYIYELVFLMVFQLKLWFFVGSLTSELAVLSHHDKDTVSHYINLFGYIQFGGILVTPVMGYVYDSERLAGRIGGKIMTPAEKRIAGLKECIAPFVITNITGVVLCVLSLFRSMSLQVPCYVLYTIVRGFLYANHGAYVGIAFPASQFGTLYGLGITIGGTFSTLEYALFSLTNDVFHGDSFWANFILLVLMIIGNIHPINLFLYCRREQKRIDEQKSTERKEE